VNLSWSFDGTSLAAARLFRNDEVIQQDVQMQGSAQDCPPDALGGTTIVYRLVVDSEFSGSASAEAAVNMVAAAEAVPAPATP